MLHLGLKHQKHLVNNSFAQHTFINHLLCAGHCASGSKALRTLWTKEREDLNIVPLITLCSQTVINAMKEKYRMA